MMCVLWNKASGLHTQTQYIQGSCNRLTHPYINIYLQHHVNCYQITLWLFLYWRFNINKVPLTSFVLPWGNQLGMKNTNFHGTIQSNKGVFAGLNHVKFVVLEMHVFNYFILQNTAKIFWFKSYSLPPLQNYFLQ